MESEVVLRSEAVEQGPELNGLGKAAAADHGADAAQCNGVSEDHSKVEGLVMEPKLDKEWSEAVAEERDPDLPKKAGSIGGSEVKSSKARNEGNGKAGESQRKRPILTQSPFFPARCTPASNLRKSTTIAKFFDSNGLEVTAGRQPAKHSNLAPAPSTRHSFPPRSGSKNVVGIDNSSEVLRSHDGNTKRTLHGKSDDDTHSTTSSTNTPRAAAHRNSTGSGFNFRLEERAEKRKEFFLKLEEKTHAKELEKTNMQEKSKENQEAEIRLLRKSLAFKATPMPIFYKEPGPTKVELKKTPPTRAKSPKLGRHKLIVAAVDDSAEGCNSCPSPRLASNSTKSNDGPAHRKGNSAFMKKHVQKSLTKSSSAKPESRPISTKMKAANTKSETKNAKVEQDHAETVKTPEEISPQNAAKEEEAICGHAAESVPISSPNEVPVRG